MTPLGHASVSYLFGRALPWWPMAGFVIGGVAPDIDFALLPLESFNSLHRLATHNVFFVLGVGVISAACLFRRPRRHLARFAVATIIAGLLHLFIDAVMDSNGSNGVGVAIFWPLSDRMFSPFNLLDPTAMGEGWSDFPRAARVALWALLLEFPLMAVALALAHRQWRQRRAAAREPFKTV